LISSLTGAERVLFCELARREDLATVGTSGKFIASLAEGQPVVWSMERSHPPESDVESAAARLRPLFLQDERVQYGRVTNALGALAQGAPEPQRELVKLLKKAWEQHETGYRWAIGSTRSGGSGKIVRSPTTSCTATWCTPTTTPDSGYGAYPRGERLVAATAWAADAIKLTLATQQLVVDLRDGGYLSPRPS